MDASIVKQDLNKEFYISERCHITEIVNSSDDPSVSIARARVEPGVTTRWHKLTRITERYYILSGEGTVEVGELKPEVVKSGDVVLIPPMCRQRISNTGTEDLIFLAICSPRFTDDCYIDDERP